MEQIISMIKIKDVNVETPKHGIDFYKDNYVTFVDEYTDYLRSTDTRYIPCFYFYKGDTIIGQSLQWYGEYTEQEINLLRQFITPETVVYDIGANIGYHTLGLAERAKHCYAFEPNRKNYHLLKLNTAHNKNITIYDYAISDDIGVCQIEDFPLGSEGNFGECKITEDGQLCDMTYIDYLVRTGVIQAPQLVKIDVEGHEWHVIQGMDQTIKNHLPVIFYENMHGSDLGKIYDYLTQLAYKVYWFPCMNYNPQNHKREQRNIFGQGGVMNAIAIPFHIEAKTNLPEIISNTDTWAEAVSRIQNAKQN